MHDSFACECIGFAAEFPSGQTAGVITSVRSWDCPNPAAGKPVDSASLVNVPQLVTAYFVSKPDPSDPTQRVAFGTSGHRGTSLKNSFNENHILATTQAICDHRRETGLTGPLFVGIDTHALAEPALVSAVRVFWV